MARYSEAQYKSAMKWDAENLDRISFATPKGQKEIIKLAADLAGESMGEYIRNAIDMRMEVEQPEVQP